MLRICFVCLGNICRSPTAEGVMQHLIAREGLEALITVDSAGTAAHHVGERADARARTAAEERGIQLKSRARMFVRADFDRFDYVLAMDQANLDDLAELCDEQQGERLFLMRSFDAQSPPGASVPDPYYGGASGFAEVFDLCEAACLGLLAHIKKKHRLGS